MTNQMQNPMLNDPLQSMWEQAGQASNGLPQPGEYKAQLMDAVRSPSKRNGAPQVQVTYRLQSDNKMLKSYFMMSSSEGLWHLRVWLELLGFQFPPHHGYLDGLLDHITQEKPLCVVEAINNDGFVYGRLVRRLDRSSPPPGLDPGQPLPVAAQPRTPIVPMRGAVGQPATVTQTTI